MRRCSIFPWPIKMQQPFGSSRGDTAEHSWLPWWCSSSAWPPSWVPLRPGPGWWSPPSASHLATDRWWHSLLRKLYMQPFSTTASSSLKMYDINVNLIDRVSIEAWRFSKRSRTQSVNFDIPKSYFLKVKENAQRQAQHQESLQGTQSRSQFRLTFKVYVSD